MRRVLLYIGAGCLATIVGLALSTFARAEIPAEAEHYRRDLTRIAQAEWGLDAPVATFAAQIHQESRWKFDAKSPAGAQGLGQVMPSTAAWLAELFPKALAKVEPYNSTWSMQALVTILPSTGKSVTRLQLIGPLPMRLMSLAFNSVTVGSFHRPLSLGLPWRTTMTPTGN